jgi:uncharacterized protein (DUF3084 family)
MAKQFNLKLTDQDYEAFSEFKAKCEAEGKPLNKGILNLIKISSLVPEDINSDTKQESSGIQKKLEDSLEKLSAVSQEKARLEGQTESKDEIIETLKNLIAAKDEAIEAKNSEINTLKTTLVFLESRKEAIQLEAANEKKSLFDRIKGLFG